MSYDTYQYDAEADALSIVTSGCGLIARTVEVVPGEVMVDYDSVGQIVHLEIIGLKHIMEKHAV